MSDIETPWLNQKEAAEYAKQSVDSIRAAVKSGDLVAYAIGKSGRDFRLNRADIDAWMRSRTWEPVA
ncbi:helix-turn-helix domain-containing protein [Mycolicibacterium fortuitum]|uniref:helix-turn-helix domain-containing protein n=1 Tax=Mycolicibacterium fortuitum TaxID=1766 RepID=UPI0014902D97|nr:helix-turn-helix domain-containing protein [Mycolicibacterium fortuitum]